MRIKDRLQELLLNSENMGGALSEVKKFLQCQTCKDIESSKQVLKQAYPRDISKSDWCYLTSVESGRMLSSTRDGIVINRVYFMQIFIMLELDSAL